VDFARRLGRILRGVAGAPLHERDPDDVLREAGEASSAPGSAPGAAPGAAPGSAPGSRSGGGQRGGGLPDEVARAYANLELTPPASLDEAKAAWRRLMARYHPDKHQQDERRQEVATKVAARLTEAYRVVREHLGG
jgi:DnaJ-domain-containing protein 1